MKPAEAISRIASRLAAAGIEDARREARIILAAALHLDAAGLMLSGDVSADVAEPIVARRAKHEPLAYILGRKEFWGLEFAVSPASLIPRPDSETIIAAVLAWAADHGGVRHILDLGTGSGCLLLAALSEFDQAFGIGLDIVPQAAALAARNAQNLGLAGRCAFAVSDWTAALAPFKFDVILSNPPYIAETEYAGLMPEVSEFEPASALYGGPDGLLAYRAIISALPAFLNESGVALLELGLGQAEPVAALARAKGLRTDFRQDMANISRVIQIRV